MSKLGKIVAFSFIAGFVAAAGAATAVYAMRGINSHAVDFLDGVQHWSEYQEAQHAVLSVLTDPDSAKIRGMFIYAAYDGHYVCGQVNARNRMGGYVGYRWFYVHSGVATIRDPDDPHRTALSIWCGNNAPTD